MKKTMTTVPFNGTAEQKAALDALIEAYRGEPGALMPVLQQAQDIYGYLPVEVQKEIAAGLDVPYSEVFGVVTFYSQFLLNPKGMSWHGLLRKGLRQADGKARGASENQAG